MTSRLRSIWRRSDLRERLMRARYRAMGLDGEVDPAKCQHPDALPGRPGDGYVPDELPWCPDCRTTLRDAQEEPGAEFERLFDEWVSDPTVARWVAATAAADRLEAREPDSPRGER